ncbi:hypothetical protein Y047_6218 [Burkholderia pseudomallei MSHR3016]|nr:hypothetical protein Y047_6218 [Burkholderia pseudomallei MSHR3016]
MRFRLFFIRISLIFKSKHGRLHSIVQNLARSAAEVLERFHVAAQDGLQVLMRRYNDPTEPAQVKRLTQMPQPVFSSSAPDEAVDDCKTGSSLQWRG